MRKVKILFFIVVIVMLLGFLATDFLKRDLGPIIEPPDESHVDLTFTPEGSSDVYKLINGDAYKVLGDGRLEFAKHAYDPDFYKKTYEGIDGKIYIKNSGDGQHIPIATEISDDFEQGDTLADLIMKNVMDEVGWTGFTLLSPQVPSDKDYIDLRRCIVAGTCSFKDNRTEPTGERAHSGKRSLRSYAVRPSRNAPVSKATIESAGLLYFEKGDDVWSSGWYYLDEGMPTTIMDIEASQMGWAGMRVFVSEDGVLSVNRKSFDMEQFKQKRKDKIVLPTGRWAHVTLHLTLSDTNDGIIELWLDDKKVIDTTGKTLPLAGAIYDTVEVGITANSYEHDAVLFVDDVVVSREPLKHTQ